MNEAALRTNEVPDWYSLCTDGPWSDYREDDSGMESQEIESNANNLSESHELHNPNYEVLLASLQYQIQNFRDRETTTDHELREWKKRWHELNQQKQKVETARVDLQQELQQKQEQTIFMLQEQIRQLQCEKLQQDKSNAVLSAQVVTLNEEVMLLRQKSEDLIQDNNSQGLAYQALLAEVNQWRITLNVLQQLAK